MIDKVILTEEQRKILDLHYLKGYTFLQISFELGYAEITICKKHKKILDKVRKILDAEQTD